MPEQLRTPLVVWGQRLLPVAFVVVAVGTAATNVHFHPPTPVPVAIVLALAALLPAVLPVPAWAALAGSGVVTGAYFAAGFSQGPIFLCLPIVAFLTTLRSAERDRRVWTWAAVGVVLGEAGLLVSYLIHDHVRAPVSWQGVGFAAVTAAAVAAASALQSRTAAARARARSAASEERLRMAADIHDGVGHGLSVIALQAGAALHVLERDPAAARASLEAIRDTSRESLDVLRSHLARLTGGDSAPRAPEHRLADVEALVARVRAGGLEVTLRVEEVPLAPAVAEMAYAVVQEGLTNVLRHAPAARADVDVRQHGDDLVVTVVDDGPGGGDHRDGLGLTAMRSRIEALGGRLEAGRAERGFRLCATLQAVPR